MGRHSWGEAPESGAKLGARICEGNAKRGRRRRGSLLERGGETGHSAKRRKGLKTMSSRKPRSLLEELRAASTPLGGPLFGLGLTLITIFTVGLFAMRAARIFALPADVSGAPLEDLVAFWRAGELALEGRAALAYDPATLHQTLSEKRAGLLFLNPPHFLLLVSPLGLLSYGAAKAVFLIASISAMVGIAIVAGRRLAPLTLGMVAFLLLSPAAFAHALVLQLGPFVALGLLAALLFSSKRPLLTGLFLALLTVKPQYGLLAPVFLIALGEWRTIFAAVGFTVLITALSMIVFGVAPWQAFVSTAYDTYAAHSARLHHDMLTVSQATGKLGAPNSLRQGLQIIAIITCMAATYAAARRFPRDAAIGLTLLLTALAAPSFWVYDWAVVIAGLYMLARSTAPWTAAAQVSACVAWAAPLISLGSANPLSGAAAPFILIATIITFWLLLQKRFHDPQSGSSISFGGSP